MKNFRVACIVSLSLSVILHFGCGKTESKPPIVITSEAYEPCCGAEASPNFEYEGVKVYFPNVFTPNGDGVNDYWYPIYSTDPKDSVNVINFTMFSNSDPNTMRSIFVRTVFHPEDLATFAFDGRDDRFQDSIHRGLFFYRMTITIKNKFYAVLEGNACSIVCDEESPIFKDKAGCYFPAQTSADNVGNNTLPNGELTCFK